MDNNYCVLNCLSKYLGKISICHSRVLIIIFFFKESEQDTEEDKQTIAQDEARVKFALYFNVSLF